MPKTKKITNIRAHFLKRLNERYGIVIAPDEYAALTKKIMRNEGDFIARESTARSHWWLDIKGLRVPVVYNKDLKGLCTALDAWQLK